MEKNMNKEAEIVEETAAVNEVTESSKEIVPADIIKEKTAANKPAAEPQITDLNIPQNTLPPKKTRGTAAKLVVLALCCSLVGGAVGAGGVIAVDRLLIRRNTKIARTQDAGPATRGLHIKKGNEQINVEVPPDSGKLTVIPDAGATAGIPDAGATSGTADPGPGSDIRNSQNNQNTQNRTSDNSKSKTGKKPTKAQDAGGQTPYTNNRPTRNNDSSQAQKPADQ